MYDISLKLYFDDLFILLKRTTLYGLTTVQYHGSDQWNTLPFCIRLAGPITDFGARLKNLFH